MENGKRAIGDTGSSEPVSALCDEKVDHGTFLETVLLLAKYDNILKCHLENVIKKCLQNKPDKHKITVQTEICLSPKLSKYLQTSGLDFINAFNRVEAMKKDIQQIHRNFAIVVTKTDHFVRHANEVLEERGCDVLIESTFPAKRVRKSKNEPLDECLSDLMKKFEVDVHNRILDQVVQSLHRRFGTHKKLYADLS